MLLALQNNALLSTGGSIPVAPTRSAGGFSRPWRIVDKGAERDRLRAAEDEARRLEQHAERERQEEEKRKRAASKELRAQLSRLRAAQSEAAQAETDFRAMQAAALREQAAQARREAIARMGKTERQIAAINAEIIELRRIDRNRKVAALMLLMD